MLSEISLLSLGATEFVYNPEKIAIAPLQTLVTLWQFIYRTILSNFCIQKHQIGVNMNCRFNDFLLWLSRWYMWLSNGVNGQWCLPQWTTRKYIYKGSSKIRLFDPTFSVILLIRFIECWPEQSEFWRRKSSFNGELLKWCYWSIHDCLS